MQEFFGTIKRYLNYRRRSVNRHGVHSPFVFSLIEEVFKDRSFIPVEQLESVRENLLNDERVLDIQDLGAGSVSKYSERRVRDVAKLSLSSPDQCRILYRIIQHLNVKTVLEFGSCLGLSAGYMAQAGAKVISMEGSSELHKLGTENFGSGADAPDFRLGSFDDLLPSISSEIESFDLIFIDGDHREKSTLRYFENCLSMVHEKSLIIFDDIHWSDGMERAWEKIRSHEEVKLSIDLYWCGMVFFDPGLSGEHFTIRY